VALDEVVALGVEEVEVPLEVPVEVDVVVSAACAC
jgi:hypothetical protein